MLDDGYPLNKVKVLVVDGGSTDGTVEIVEEILQKYGVDHRVVVTHDSIPEARNRCIEEAITSGFNYLLSVDSDVITSFKDIINCLLKKKGKIILP